MALWCGQTGQEIVGSCVGTERFQSDSVAQLAEQWTFNPLVLGSSPSGVTTFFIRFNCG